MVNTKIPSKKVRSANTVKKSVNGIVDSDAILFKDGTRPQIHSLNYMTTQDKFKIHDNNRGCSKGYNEKRTNGLAEIFSTGKFIWEMSTIKTILKNGELIVIDGANRIAAIRKLIDDGLLGEDYLIPFTVIKDKRMNNLSKNELIVFIAAMNEYDPRWTEDEHFDSAINANLKTANAFQRYLNRLNDVNIAKKLKYEKDGSVKRVRIGKNVLLCLAKRMPMENNGKRTKFNDYRDDNVANYMSTEHFENDFNALIDFIDIVKEWHSIRNISVSKSIFRVLDIVYHEEKPVPFSYIVRVLKSTNKMPTSNHTVKKFILSQIYS